MIKAVLICLLALIGLSGRTQTEMDLPEKGAPILIQVSGQVTDTLSIPLSHVTVQLISASDTLSTMTGDDGKFMFRNVKTRIFQISVSMKGYMPMTKSLSLDNGKTRVQLSSFLLRVNYEGLDPVIVSQIRPVTLSGDTLSYNTSAFPVREGSEVEDILRRLPGIEVDLDGNIIVQGKKVTKVTVNGKDFFGGDVLLAIRNLPADIVSKLQIIDDYGDKSRLTGIKVEEPSKVLNIVLKPDKQSGKFGHIQAGAGNDSKYAEELFGNAFQGERQLSVKADAKDDNITGKNPNKQVAFSYANQWGPRWRAGFTGSTNIDNSHTGSILTQQNFYPGQQTNLQQSTISDSHSDSYTVGGTLNLNPNTGSILRITPSFDGHYGTSRSVTNFNSLEQDSGFTKTTSGSSTNTLISDGWHTGSSLYYEKIMPGSQQRFSIESDVSYMETEEHADNLTVSNILVNSAASRSLLHYLIVNSSRNLSLSFRSNYYYPISPGKLIEVGYSLQSYQSHYDRVTRSPDSVTGTSAIIDSLSLADPYSTLIHRLHSGYEANYHSLALTATMDGEWGQLSGIGNIKTDKYTYSYFAPLPRARLRWKLSRKHSISFQYEGSSTVPTLQQVIPTKDISNPQYPITGNPKLKPSYPQSGSLGYEYTNLRATQFSGFGISVGASVIPDPIITVINHPRDNSQVIQAATYLNSGRIVSYSFGYHFDLPAFLQKHFRITGNGSLTRNQTPIMTDGLSYANTNVSWNQAFHFQYSLANSLDIDLDGNYSITHSEFSTPSQLPGTLQAASWQFGGRVFLFSNWLLAYRFTQLYVSSGDGLRPSPSTLTASLQRDFLSHKRASIIIAGNNLLNSPAASTQTVTPTTITLSQANYIGRFFILKFIFKLQRFQ